MSSNATESTPPLTATTYLPGFGNTTSISYYCNNGQKTNMLQDLGLFLTGLVVGAMNAIAGGGTLIGFPVLLATGLPALVANATSHLVVLPGTLSSAYGYRKYIKK